MTDLVQDAAPVAVRRIAVRSAAIAEWIRRFGAVVSVYIAATLVTSAQWMGDTVDYVESIVLFRRGIDHWMWDFAHVLWRPAGWVLSSIFEPVTRMFVGSNESLNVMATLTAINWVAGLVCVVCLQSLALRFSNRVWVANVVVATFVVTHAFLNWSQTGSAYTPALALMLIALHLSVTDHDSNPLRGMLAGVALAASVCIWVPMLVVVPAVALSASILRGFTRERLRSAALTVTTFGVLTAVVYITVMTGLRLTTLNAIRNWIAVAGHGVDYGGGKRMIFGFARSFISTGNDGLLFKRYLLHDSYNPVALRDLATTTLWKIAIVYAVMAALFVTLLQPRNRRVLALVIAAAAPTFLLAYLFGGSEPERYLAFTPFLFLATASSFETTRVALRTIAALFVVVIVATNGAAMANPRLAKKQEAAAARVQELLPRLDERSLVFAATYQDELMTFTRTYPFHPLNRDTRFHLSVLVSPGTSWNEHWCEDFATRVFSTWQRGGATWISKRALSDRPRSEWNWAEGDDRRVAWRDFPQLFSHLELGDSVGGTDGFVQLLASTHNKQFLSGLTTARLVAERSAAH